MKYQQQTFSVMPGAIDAYRDNYDRIFRGEASGTEAQVNTESEVTSPPGAKRCGRCHQPMRDFPELLSHECPGGLE